VSVASVTAAVVLPLAVLGLAYAGHTNGLELFYVSLCLAVVGVFRHRSNLSRLVQGSEPRFKRRGKSTEPLSLERVAGEQFWRGCGEREDGEGLLGATGPQVAKGCEGAAET